MLNNLISWEDLEEPSRSFDWLLKDVFKRYQYICEEYSVTVVDNNLVFTVQGVDHVVDLSTYLENILVTDLSIDGNNLKLTLSNGTIYSTSLVDVIKQNETVTDLSYNNNVLTYTNEAGTVVNVTFNPVTATSTANSISITLADASVVSFTEKVTALGTPNLSGSNILTIPFTNELGINQTVSVDLNGIVTNSIQIDTATYNAGTNIITITENNGDVININLSEFSIVANTNLDGSVAVTQEGVTKFTIPPLHNYGQVEITGTLGQLSYPVAYITPISNVILTQIKSDTDTGYFSDYVIEIDSGTGFNILYDVQPPVGKKIKFNYLIN